jgi:hypothetical protein
VGALRQSRHLHASEEHRSAVQRKVVFDRDCPSAAPAGLRLAPFRAVENQLLRCLPDDGAAGDEDSPRHPHPVHNHQRFVGGNQIDGGLASRYGSATLLTACGYWPPSARLTIRISDCHMPSGHIVQRWPA